MIADVASAAGPVEVDGWAITPGTPTVDTIARVRILWAMVFAPISVVDTAGVIGVPEGQEGNYQYKHAGNQFMPSLL
jgi:hypothetical protein